MPKTIKKIGVLTSGGDSPGMNAAIRSVVRTCAYHNLECIGIYRGYQGMIEGDFKEMGPRSVNNIVNKGGTILKSARSTEFRTPEGREKAHENLLKAGIDALVVIGGDGTFTGGLLFNNEFNFNNQLFKTTAIYFAVVNDEFLFNKSFFEIKFFAHQVLVHDSA